MKRRTMQAAERLISIHKKLLDIGCPGAKERREAYLQGLKDMYETLMTWEDSAKSPVRTFSKKSIAIIDNSKGVTLDSK